MEAGTEGETTTGGVAVPSTGCGGECVEATTGAVAGGEITVGPGDNMELLFVYMEGIGPPPIPTCPGAGDGTAFNGGGIVAGISKIVSHCPIDSLRSCSMTSAKALPHSLPRAPKFAVSSCKTAKGRA